MKSMLDGVRGLLLVTCLVAAAAGAQSYPAKPIRLLVGFEPGGPNDTQARIVFLPDGGSSGGVVDVQRPTGQGTRIRVDWLMGQISQEPRTP